MPRTELGRAIGRLDREHPRPGLRVVVSDFHEDDWADPLRRLTARHEVIAVEVLDPRELELPDVGLLTLVDPETGRRREVQTANRKLRRRYADAMTAHRDRTARAIRAAGAAHLVLRTDQDWVRDVAAFTDARRRAGVRRHPTGRTGIR